MHLGKHIKEQNSQAILRGLDLSAHCLNVKTWVKMIEEPEGAKTAQDIGINFLQGNYIGTIAPLEDFLEKKQ